MLTLFIIIFLANSFTTVITIAGAVKRPSLSYTLMAAAAFCATLFALQQIVTGQGNPFALLCTVLLIIMIAWSGIIYPGKKH
jgi:hypothetical protein